MALFFPKRQNGVAQLPGGLRFVASDEERAVSDHGVDDEAFVGFGRVGSVRRSVAEVHAYGLGARLKPGDLRVDQE